MTKSNQKSIFRWVTFGCGGLFFFGFIGFSCLATAMTAVSDNLHLAGAPLNRDFIEVHQQGSDPLAGKLVSIQLSGPILESDSNALYGKGIATELMGMLDTAQKDESVKGVLVWIDSPGGSVTDSDLLLNRLKELAAKKPVLFLMDDMCASGCIYSAVGATEIWSHPTTVTGSIGVIIQGINFSEFLTRHGIQDRSITSGTHKAMLSPTRPENKESTQIMQTIVDQMYERFVMLVAENRNLPLNDVKAFSDGRLLTASQAKDVGLIDAIGQEKDALARLKELANAPEEIQIVRYVRQPSFYDLLQQMSPRPSMEAAVYQQLATWPKVMLMPQTQLIP